MPFCSNCGSNVNDGDRFCQGCGVPRASPVRSIQTPPHPAFSQYVYGTPQVGLPTNPAQVVAIMPQARKMKMLGLYDSYTIIFTPVQIIVARLTNNVIKDVVNQSQAKSKAEGKGWMGIVGDQMQAFGAAHTRYYKMTPQQILTETAGNFALDHRSINLVKVKTGCEGGDEEGPGVDYTEVEFETAAVKYKYRLSMNAKDVINILNNFYPGRIKR